MTSLAQDLRQIVAQAAGPLQAVSDARSAAARIDGQWTAKQILGHLIDSAANNHQRFVRVQFMDNLVFPGYDQEQWIAVQHYQEAAWPALVELWRLYNLHLAHVIDHLPAETLTRRHTQHSLDKIAWQAVPAGEPTTLEYLIRDYLGHLQDHLAQLSAALSA